jgi:hypothetical protein
MREWTSCAAVVLVVDVNGARSSLARPRMIAPRLDG